MTVHEYNNKGGKITFKGLIVENDNYGPGSGVYVVDVEKGRMGAAFADTFPDHCKASVRYAIASSPNWPETLDEVAADEISKLDGHTKADYYDRYSDLTGYLWTEENAIVGGHDLVHLLKFNVGKYLWMEVEYIYG